MHAEQAQAQRGIVPANLQGTGLRATWQCFKTGAAHALFIRRVRRDAGTMGPNSIGWSAGPAAGPAQVASSLRRTPRARGLRKTLRRVPLIRDEVTQSSHCPAARAWSRSLYWDAGAGGQGGSRKTRHWAAKALRAAGKALCASVGGRGQHSPPLNLAREGAGVCHGSCKGCLANALAWLAQTMTSDERQAVFVYAAAEPAAQQKTSPSNC